MRSCQVVIELVDIAAYRRIAADNNHSVVDLDVNNLKFSSSRLAKKEPTEGGSLATIIRHCQQKVFLPIKPDSMIRDRLRKMKERHWF